MNVNQLLDLTQRPHAMYGGSGAHRWGHCAGSIVMGKETSVKQTPQRYTSEGTLGHAMSEACQKNKIPATDFITGAHVNVDGFAFLIEQEFAEHVQVYIDAVAERAAAEPGAVVLLEAKVNYASLLGIKPDEAYAYLDNTILFTDEICVIDLKMGQGEVVDPEENDQGIVLAAGAYLEYADLMGYDETTKVTIVVHQPRVRRAAIEWVTTIGHVMERMGELAVTVAASKQALWDYADLKNRGMPQDELRAWYDKYLNPSEKSCRWCAAKPTCPKARAVVTQAVINQTPASPDEFEDLTKVPNIKAHVSVADNDWLEASMAAVPFIKDWVKAVAQEIDRRALSGVQFKNFKVVLGQQGDRAWSDAEAVETYLKKTARLRTDQMYSLKLIGPAGAERLTKGDKPPIGERQWAKLQESIVRAEGSPQVVPISDGRPPITVADVADEFEDLMGDDQQSVDALQDLVGDQSAPVEDDCSDLM